MLLKLGVDISRLRKEIRIILPVIENLFDEEGIGEPVITSTYEGDHGVGSLHYQNLAIDFRSWSLNTLNIAKRLREKIGNDYDVVVEIDNIHVEYDPD